VIISFLELALRHGLLFVILAHLLLSLFPVLLLDTSLMSFLLLLRHSDEANALLLL